MVMCEAEFLQSTSEELAVFSDIRPEGLNSATLQSNRQLCKKFLYGICQLFCYIMLISSSNLRVTAGAVLFK